MKISYMLKREDFYSINEHTLDSFFEKTSKNSKLFVYPELNAIIRRFPSKDVKKYIYTEYSVNGSLLKRALVWLYTRISLNSFGLLSSRKISIAADISNDMLIYPCNRKYRIFDFKNGNVSVVTKYGFSSNCLHNEIEFREKNRESVFILPIQNHTYDCYTEKIIDGIPLARIPGNTTPIKERTLSAWREYSQKSLRLINASEYADELEKQIADATESAKALTKAIDYETLKSVCQKYLNIVRNGDKQISLIQSHGDLQSGNIWVENRTGRVYIIDWESVRERSIRYDEVVLFDDIRKTHMFAEFIKSNDYYDRVVLLEEIIYRLNELTELPFNYGSENFDAFVRMLWETGNKNV